MASAAANGATNLWRLSCNHLCGHPRRVTFCQQPIKMSGELDWKTFLAGAVSPLVLWGVYKLTRSVIGAALMRVDDKPHATGLKVVITGSTRGLGLHLARQFLSLGDDVVISGRSAAAVDEAVGKLREEFPGCQVVGVAGDVARAADVERLASKAVEELGQIDIWVQNAALSARHKTPVASSTPAELTAIVGTNLGGALLGARSAIARMTTQPAGGKLFLVDGNGSWGNPTPGNAAYGATKRALVQLKDSLAAEAAGSGVGVHMFSPGMVATDLLLRYADNPRSARIINVLAEEPGTVAAWLVPRLRGARGSGKYIKYLTMPDVFWRFATAAKRRNRFCPEGNVVGAPGYQRLPSS